MSEEFFENKEKSGVRRDGYTPQSNGNHSRYGGQQPRARFNREARIDNTSYNAQRGYSENYAITETRSVIIIISARGSMEQIPTEISSLETTINRATFVKMRTAGPNVPHST
mgnify:CR=1 FL=1